MSKRGEVVAVFGKELGFGGEDKILKDLREDSETLTDLLYHLTLCLSRMFVPTVCFFELHKTDYGCWCRCWRPDVSPPLPIGDETAC